MNASRRPTVVGRSRCGRSALGTSASAGTPRWPRAARSGARRGGCRRGGKLQETRLSTDSKPMRIQHLTDHLETELGARGGSSARYQALLPSGLSRAARGADRCARAGFRRVPVDVGKRSVVLLDRGPDSAAPRSRGSSSLAVGVRRARAEGSGTLHEGLLGCGARTAGSVHALTFAARMEYVFGEHGQILGVAGQSQPRDERLCCSWTRDESAITPRSRPRRSRQW